MFNLADQVPGHFRAVADDDEGRVQMADRAIVSIVLPRAKRRGVLGRAAGG